MTLRELDPEHARALLQEFDSPDHDILLLRPDPGRDEASLLSCPVVRAASPGAQPGDYRDPPVTRHYADPGVRKVMSVARELVFSEPAGPTFATLPVKPEPGSSSLWCYFVDTKRLGRGRWSYAPEPTTPPPSLLVAEDSGNLRLYESVGTLDAGASSACRQLLEAGFVIGTLPNSAAYGPNTPGKTAVVNLTSLEPSPGRSDQELPDVAIITPHDGATGQAKVFLFRSPGSAQPPAPVEITPSDPLYLQLTRFSAQGQGGGFDAGAALTSATVEGRQTLVISARNLLYKNEWIRAEWAGPPQFAKLASVIDTRPSLVVATADGGLHKYVGGVASLQLALNTDAWNQLRNGCVLGTVQRQRVGSTESLAALEGDGAPIPLVNLSSLEPDSGPVAQPTLGSALQSGALSARLPLPRIPPQPVPVPKAELTRKKV